MCVYTKLPVMTSIKVKFRPSTVPGREGTIYYQIIHDRAIRRITTAYHIFPSEWNEVKFLPETNHKSDRYSLIVSFREQIKWDRERLEKIIGRLDTDGTPYTVDKIIKEFQDYTNSCSLFNYMESEIIRLKRRGKRRTSETYLSALRSFKSFRHGEDIMLDNLTSTVMADYEIWLKRQGVVANTISFYMRILRAVYNRSVEEGLIDDRHPFRHVYTGHEKTVKRALSLEILKKIKALDLDLSPTLDYTRDIFLLSFMLRGMSFIDMAFLRKEDLKNGYVTYCRRKTGQRLTIAWTEEMQIILDKYPENPTKYLLPIITKTETNEWYAYRYMGYKINKQLKKIAKLVGISGSLTLYVSRHSWASIANSKGIPLKVISEGMGHDSETTTQIYIASLDNSVIDRANASILKCL